jgi:eukaryotic-like serine/threonine-protein kinase
MPAYHCPNCLAAYRLDVSHCPRDGGELCSGEDPLIGVVLGERYHVEALLGEGGMARVYRVLHVGLQKTFALKAIFGDLAMDARMAARFELEARAASRLDHPNIVSTVDFAATPDGLLFLVLEYLEGQDLGHILVERGPLPPAEALGYFRQMMQGMAHAHARGLVHRDLKPDNLFIVPRDGKPHLKIVDFGLAHLVDARPEDNERITRAGEIFGTPEFMAPEQVRGGDITARTDLYAAGIILYQLLSGQTPFASDNPTDTLLRQCTDEPAALGAGGNGPDLPPRVNDLIRRLLAKDPGGRPESAAAVLAETEGIETVVRDQPAAVPQRPVTPVPRTASVPPRTITGRRPRVRGARMWLGLASAATSVASGAFFLHAALRRTPPAAAKGSAGDVAAATPEAASAVGPAPSEAGPAAKAPAVAAPAPVPAAAEPPAPAAAPPQEPAAPAPRSARSRRHDERWLKRGEALLTAQGLSMADLQLEPRLGKLWGQLDGAADRGDLWAADRTLEQIGNALQAFDYPRVLLKKKIERLYRDLDVPGEGPERGLLRALLDAEVVRLPRALASREGRRDLWREVSRLEDQARKKK